MKIYNSKNLMTMLTCAALTLALSISSATHAQDAGNGKFSGFEKGKHEGHSNDNGKRKGHENERNPWNSFYNDTSGTDFELTIHHHGVMPNITFTMTYNSMMTIQEVLTDILEDSTDGFALQECFEEYILLQGIESDCTEGESPVPLDSSLTLEEAGIVDDPEVHLVYTSG